MKRIILLLLVITTSYINTFSSHLSGAELTYDWVQDNGDGTSDYLITLQVYRDCSGQDYQNSYIVNYLSPGCDPVVQDLEVFTIGGATDVSPEAACGIPTLCSDITAFVSGIQKQKYQATVTLNHCNSYKFFWGKLGRNDGILTNVVNLSIPGQAMYVEMEFNSTAANNSGPILLDNIMSQTICAGEYFSFNFDSTNFSLNNPDGDSLSFELVQTKVNSGGGILMYENGFSSFIPIIASGFNLSADGLLEFTAGLAQSSIITVKITEYDALGNVIGYVLRDMNINVVNCNNNAPAITGIDGTQEDTIYMCGGSTQCFYIYGSDVDGDNITRTSFNVTPLGGPARFSSPSDQYRFCFNPTQTGTWTIDLGFTDNVCPDAIESRRTITVIVPNDSLFQCNCATVDFDYDNICLGSTTTFSGNAYPGLGASVTSWNWDFAGQATSTSATPSHTFTTAGDYDITLTMNGDNGCSKTSTSTLHICDIPNTGFMHLDSCQVAAIEKNPVRFLDTTTSDCNIFRRAWDYGDGNADPLAPVISGSNEYLDTGLFTIQQIIEYGDPDAPTKCYDTTSRQIRIYPKPKFTIQPDNFYQSCDPTYDTLYYLTLVDTSNLIQWTLNGDLVPDYLGGEDDTLNINTLTLTEDSFNIRDIEILVRAEDSLGCYEDSLRTIYDPVKPRFLNTPYCETGDTIFFWDITDTLDNISALHYGLVDREWDFGDPSTTSDISSDSNSFYVYPSDDIYYADLYYLDNDSCYDWAARPTIKAVLPDDVFNVYASGDPDRDNDTICFNNQTVIFEGPGNDRAEINTYIWYLDDTTNVDSVVVQNLYNGTWTKTWLNDGLVTSSSASANPNISYLYSPINFGKKYIHLKMIYNTIRNDRNSLVDSLYCVRHYDDTIDIRPPQEIDIRTQNRCDYETNEMVSIHLPGGDTLIDWFVDFGDECVVGCGGLVYSDNDTITNFGSVDSIYAEYKYSAFGLPDRKGIRIKTIVINDVYGCVNTFNYQDTVIKVDTQVINPLNYCDNESMFFPPNSVNNANDLEWADDFENIVELFWDFGVTDILSDTLLFNLTDDTKNDSVIFTYPDDTVYTVTLTAYTHNRECKTDTTLQLAIQPAPIARLDIFGGSCVGLPVSFLDKSITRGLWELNQNNDFVKVEDTLTNWILYVDGDTIIMQDDITITNGDTINVAGTFADGVYPYTYSTSYYDTVVLVAITDTGCLSADTIFPVYTAPYPIANFGFESSLPGPRSELVFTDSTDWIEENIQHPDSAYRWTLTDDEGNVQFFEMGWDLEEVIYTIDKEDIFNMQLIAQNEFGCTDTISKEIDSYSYLDFPTAFSPTEDGDPRNNAFRLHHKGFKELLEYRIFNRYGEVVFIGESLDDLWDGRYKSRLQETGMYVVVVRAVDVLDREKQLKKNVLLVR